MYKRQDQAGEHPPYGWRWDTRKLPLANAVDYLAPRGIQIVPVPFDVDTVNPPAGY